MDHSRNFHAALVKAGKDLAYLELPIEGHGFGRPGRLQKLLVAHPRVFCQAPEGRREDRSGPLVTHYIRGLCRRRILEAIWPPGGFPLSCRDWFGSRPLHRFSEHSTPWSGQLRPRRYSDRIQLRS